jgi:hypothetical protein
VLKNGSFIDALHAGTTSTRADGQAQLGKKLVSEKHETKQQTHHRSCNLTNRIPTSTKENSKLTQGRGEIFGIALRNK